MTLRPREADYDIELLDGGVCVTFRPTASEFVYQQLADPDDIAREGPLSRLPNVRHAQTSDTGRYDEREIEALAFKLASEALGGPL
jgi:hypothetical protein